MTLTLRWLRLALLTAGLLLAGGAILGAEQAQAFSVTASTTNCPAGAPATCGNPLDNTVGGADTTRSELTSGASVEQAPCVGCLINPGDSTTFIVRYTSILAVDSESTANNCTVTCPSINQTSYYQVQFTISDPLNQSYSVQIDTRRLGSLVIVDDSSVAKGPGNVSATADIGAMTASLDGNSQTELGLPDIAALTSTGAAASSSFTQDPAGTAMQFFGVGTHTYTLLFSWTATTQSSRDEGAVRLGRAGQLTGVTADDYSGVTAGSLQPCNATFSNCDGHFVVVTVIVPGLASLLSLGLGAVTLGVASRRRRLLLSPAELRQ